MCSMILSAMLSALSFTLTPREDDSRDQTSCSSADVHADSAAQPACSRAAQLPSSHEPHPRSHGAHPKPRRQPRRRRSPRNHEETENLGTSSRGALALGDDELPAAARRALREAIRRDESDRREAEASVREEEAAQEAADTLVASVSKNASEVSLASAETRSPPHPRAAAAEPVPAR